MQKSDLTILIVDDDVTLGKAIREAILRSGMKAVHVMKPDEALAIVKLQPIHAAIVDCMLPKMNGRLLAKKLREEMPELPIFLMSGIYKDKNFVREAVQETGALAFLTKPFDLVDLMTTLDNKLESKVEAPMPPLKALFLKDSISHKERIKTINAAEEIHGFELPWVFSLLLHPKIRGYLNIVGGDGEICGVGVQDGKIVQVNTNDTKSYFGVLMVEYGFISQDDLEDVMRTGKTKKMGERLVEANVLSPHAIEIVMTEQQNLRLSRTITDAPVQVNFVDSDEDIREDASTDRMALTNLINEWMLSKVKIEWLRSSYLPWMAYNVKEGAAFDKDHPAFSIPVVQRASRLMACLLGQPSLEHALSASGLSEEVFFPALHVLMLTQMFRFGEAVNMTDMASHQKRLTNLLVELEKQNFYERLHVIPKAKESDIKHAYHELAKILHPDKLGKEVPADIRDMTKKCFALISVAYEALSDPQKKVQYAIELEKGKAESILAAEQLIESARPLLTKGDSKQALNFLDEARRLAPPTVEAILLHMWARMKGTNGEAAITAINAKIRDELLKIPPEERHTATFYFVRGLHLRLSGDFDGAQKNLTHAVSLDPDFIDARRELVVLSGVQTAAAPKGDLLRGDLKDVVGMLFKKKK